MVWFAGTEPSVQTEEKFPVGIENDDSIKETVILTRRLWALHNFSICKGDTSHSG